ncbi:heterokaryon incompatibility protein-domain-containing protein [Xylariaceae sp. FL0255]|nr:heterokaryon incompatibility protein-domain-containing protein [Xylariaceae sp. FL0255]
MSNSESIYRALGKRSIRLLEIVPALPDEQIECALTVVHNIEEAPAFEALSYVWGEALSPEPIICNGLRITVTQNLLEALRYLRPLPEWESVQTWSTKHSLHSSRHVWRSFAKNRYEQQENATSFHQPFWVDALCINQDDLDERADQVKLMRNIYQKASTTKIWLGKGDLPASDVPVTVGDAISEQNSLPPHLRNGGGSSQQLTPINKLHRALAPRHHMEVYGSMPIVLTFLAQALRNLDVKPSSLRSVRSSDLKYGNSVYGLPSPSAREWKVFRQFLENPWFRRIWIVQEAVLSKNPIVVLGNWHVKWDAMGKALAWYETKGFGMPRTMKYIPKDLKDLLPVAPASSLWQMSQSPTKRVPLLTLLKDFRSRLAGQDVDKLYAALGLAQEMEDHGLTEFHVLVEPDYNKRIEDVYRDLAIFLIIEHGSLLVLSHVDRSPTEASNWPSWVPDWRVPKASSEIWNSCHERSSFCADGNEPLSMDVGQDFNTLSLEGLFVDVVRFYGDKLRSYGPGFDTHSQEPDFVHSAWNLAKSTMQDSDGIKKQVRAFIATLITNDTTHKLDAMMEAAARWLSKHLPGHFSKIGVSWFGERGADPGHFHDAFVRACIEKRFFITRDGRMGIGPESMKEGDSIVILFGAKVPFIIRSLGPRHTIIGECYVSNIMRGEFLEQWKITGQPRTRFEIY